MPDFPCENDPYAPCWQVVPQRAYWCNTCKARDEAIRRWAAANKE